MATLNNLFDQKLKNKMHSIYKVIKYNDKNNTKTNINQNCIFINTTKHLCNEIIKNDFSYHFLINNNTDYILYADIDGYLGKIENLFEHFVIFFYETYNITMLVSDFCYTMNTYKKGSYHITNPLFFCKSQVQKNIFNNFLQKHKQHYLKIIDTSVYGISWYRCANQTKGDNSLGKHIPKIGTYLDTLIFHIPNNSTDINNIIPINNSLVTICSQPALQNITLQCEHPIINIPQIIIKPNYTKTNTPNYLKEIFVIKQFFDKCFKQYRFDNYAEWIKIGLSIKNSLGENGLELYHYFSSKSSSYKKEECDIKWISFKDNNEDVKVSIATIYYIAKVDNREIYYEIISTSPMLSNINISEYDIAEYILYIKGNDFIWKKGILYAFNGRQWVYDENSKEDYASILIRKYIMKDIYYFLIDNLILTDNKLESENKRRSLNQLKRIHFQNNVVSIAKDLFFNNSIMFDTNPYLLPFNNLICDLKTNTFRKYNKNDYITQYINYDWREPTTNELEIVNKLICQIMPNVEERKLYLTILSTCLDGNNKPFFAMFQASGRNGKGLIDDFLDHALTKIFSIHGSSSLLFQSSTSGTNPEIANLGSKRLVLFQELDDSKGNKLNNAFLKSATGGAEWLGRQCYSNVTCHTNSSTIIIECNEKLLFQSPPDTAERDRLVYIFFPSYFTINKNEVDESKNIYLAEESYKSLSFRTTHKFALLRILLDTYQIYISNGEKLFIPPFVKQRTDEYLENSSGLMGWFKEFYERIDPDNVNIVFTELSSIYSFFISSDYYKNMDRKEKQAFGKYKFYTFFKENCFLKYDHVNEKVIKQRKYKNILLNWRKLEDNEDLFDDLN